MQDRKSDFQPLALLLTAAAALLRLAPHPPNFTPIGGLGLFAGSRLPGWQAYVIPLLAMLATDPILSRMAGYPAYSPATLVIYCSVLIYVFLGRTLIGKNASPVRMAAVSVLGSVQFFLITNFYEWRWSVVPLYPHTLGGLTECYVAALPFFGWTLAGDLFYSALLFTAYALLNRRAEGAVSRSAH